MENKIKVGDKFRVFEVTDDIYRIGLNGKHFAECNDVYLGNKYGINSPFNSNNVKNFHFNLTSDCVAGHVKQIGQLVITKVK